MESELLAKMETLKNVHESWMQDQDVAARRTRQERGEITDPLHTFKEVRLQCMSTVAIKGGKVSIDAGSLVTSCEHDKRFEESGDIAVFENKQALDQVKIHVMVEDIDRIFLADGHGIFVAFEEGCAEIVTRSYAAGKVIAVVCNDISGLVGANSAEPFVRCGSSLVFWSVAGIWMEELAQRLRHLKTQVGRQRAVIELQRDQLMRQYTTLDADRATRVLVTPIAQDTRAHLTDLRVGNKLETIAGESIT